MAWSYTALTSFEQCPKRHFHVRVAKDVIEPETQSLTWGRAVHKALELRMKEDAPLPLGMTQWEPLCARIAALGGDLFTERQIALDKAFKPCAPFSKDTWVRGVIDVGILKDDKLIVLDYKTGKPNPDSEQLKLFSALGMALFPEVETVRTGYVWLQTNDLTTEQYQRSDLPVIWGAFLMRLKRMDRAFHDDYWPENPSGLCRHHCPVTLCKFNGKYRGGGRSE